MNSSKLVTLSANSLKNVFVLVTESLVDTLSTLSAGSFTLSILSIATNVSRHDAPDKPRINAECDGVNVSVHDAPDKPNSIKSSVVEIISWRVSRVVTLL